MSNPKPGSAFGERSLAAIVFTDVVGFSSRSYSNETQALRSVSRDFDLMAPIISKHHGHLLKTLGDGQLISFSSAINAVSCALEMQQAVAEAARQLPPEEVLMHRIGIHLGDVFVSDKDVHGNGVNIAARLQGQAEPGGICISQTVYEVVKHQLSCKVIYLGAQELKNIADAIHVYRLLQDFSPSNIPLTVAQPVASVAPPKAPSRASSLDFTFRSNPASSASRSVDSDDVLSLLVLGDFTGRSTGSLAVDRSQNAIAVDVDNFDEVMRQVNLQVPLVGTETAAIEFTCLADFHPDRLLRRIPSLCKLMELRRRLVDPAKAPAAESEIAALLGDPSLAVAPIPTESDDDVLLRLLGKTRQEAKPGAGQASAPLDINALIKSIAGSGVPAAQGKHKDLLSRLDERIAQQLRGVLHHPDFQAIEASWRGLDLLVREFGGEENIKLFVYDVSKAELEADLVSGSLENSTLAAVVANRRRSVILANFAFSNRANDLSLLQALALLAEKNQAPLIGAANSDFVGCASFATEPDPGDWKQVDDARKAWAAFRATTHANWIALALPRFIIRQPYGKASDPIEAFPFDEVPLDPPHNLYLWANSVFACGHVIAELFRDEGHDGLRSSPVSGELGSLPWCKYNVKGEVQVKPCAEAWLSERACNELIQQGFSPLQSIKNQSAVRVVTVQPVTPGATRLRF